MGVCFEASTLLSSELSDCFFSIFIYFYRLLAVLLSLHMFSKALLRDSSRNSRLGFWVKVGHKKTYIIRSKVYDKSIKPTVGTFANFK